MNNLFYVYVYSDPRKKGCYIYGSYKFKYEPFYIGKGKNSRLKDHLFEKSNPENKRKYTRILNIKKQTGKNPIIFKYSKNLTETQSFNLEIDMILKIGRNILNEGPLLNIQPGGSGFSGWIPTDNWYRKNREGQKRRWSKKENREKQSKKLKEVGKRKSFKEKVSKITSNRWKNNRNLMLSYQQQDDVKRKKSLASIKIHSKIWILISPEGEKFITNRLKDFCNKNGLKSEMLQRVAMGKQLHHKKWLCFKNGEETKTKEKLRLLKIERQKIELQRVEKLRIASSGRKKSNEEKIKIGLAQLGNKHGVYYKHTEEAIEKIRQSSINMWKSRKEDKREV